MSRDNGRHARTWLAFLLCSGLAAGSAPAQEMPLDWRSVYGGKQATPQEAPWQAVIFLSNEGPYSGLLCGGTVIAPQWILTAAHCFYNSLSGVLYPDHLVTVAIGSTSLRGPLQALQRHGAPIIPRDYAPGKWDYDIALIRLTEPVTTRPIALALPADERQQNRLFRVTGWGRTETVRVSSNLLYADVPAIPAEACAKAPDYEARLTERLLCAGAVGRDTCKGDSGGPLYERLGEGAAIQFGVTAAGEGCGANPGVYSRVTQYRMWIEKEIAATNSKLTDSAQLRHAVSICTPERQFRGFC
jgi:secreted trypsin-like serine protease